MMVRIIRADIHWLIFYSFIFLSWVLVLLTTQDASDIASYQSIYGADFWKELCGQASGYEDLLSLILMWIIMSGAMMMPTLLPTLRTYQDLIHAGAGTPFGFLLMTFGFLMIWVFYSIVLATLQALFIEQSLVDINGRFTYPLVSTLLLLATGLYQFSAFKDACASKCRAPLSFFMEFWGPGFLQSYKMGLRLGLSCLGCCWMLMLLAFVGGTMSLGFMGFATVIMVFEKLPQLGEHVSRPLGCVLIACAGLNLLM